MQQIHDLIRAYKGRKSEDIEKANARIRVINSVLEKTAEGIGNPPYKARWK